MLTIAGGIILAYLAIQVGFIILGYIVDALS